jgi:Methyltransferase domain
LQPGSEFRPQFSFILISNYRVWGLKSLFFWTGISRYEYFEFSYVLSNLPPRNSRWVDVGSGHSLLPIMLCSLGYELVGLDLDRDAMRWQLEHSRGQFDGIVADARFLPFRQNSFDMGSAISSLEHIRGNGDSAACHEIVRSLSARGYMIVTLPGSRGPVTVEVENYYAGIPSFAEKLTPLIKPLFKALGVDRSRQFFERNYSVEDARKRIVPIGCVLEQEVGDNLARNSENWIHRVIPVGTNAVMEWILAHFMEEIDLSKTRARPGGILFLVRKAPES